jgi:serine/threonine protein kinase
MALSSIHQIMIIHRDIKTSNLHVDDLGTLILSDFGFLKLAIQSEKDFEDYIGPLKGSERYCPPEWITEHKTVTEKSDIW